MNKALSEKRSTPGRTAADRRIAAGEFKAKCLRIMDEVKETGLPVIVTKRGQPVIRVVPFAVASKQNGNRKQKDDFFGRLVGVMKIAGDPDDLIKPVFALEEYDMLR